MKKKYWSILLLVPIFLFLFGTVSFAEEWWQKPEYAYNNWKATEEGFVYTPYSSGRYGLNGFKSAEAEKAYVAKHGGVFKIPTQEEAGVNYDDIDWVHYYDVNDFETIVFPSELKDGVYRNKNKKKPNALNVNINYCPNHHFHYGEKEFWNTKEIIFEDGIREMGMKGETLFDWSQLLTRSVRTLTPGIVFDGIYLPKDIFTGDNFGVSQKNFSFPNLYIDKPDSDNRRNELPQYKFTRTIYSNLDDLKQYPLVVEQNKMKFLNPVRVRLRYVDSKGNDIAKPEYITGKTSCDIKLETKEHNGDKYLDVKYPEREDGAERYLHDYSIYLGEPIDINDFEVIEPGVTYANPLPPREFYFRLLDDKKETFKPKEIEGYLPVSEPVTIDFKNVENSDLTKDPDGDRTKQYVLNKDDFVWERDIVFQYKKDESLYTTVNFYVDGKVTPVKVKKGETIPEEKVPELPKDKEFEGWVDENGNLWDLKKAPVEDTLTLTAKFKTTPVKPDVDKGALRKLVQTIESQEPKEEEYTPETWNMLKKDLDYAKFLLEEEDVTQASVDYVKGSLEKSYKALEKKPKEPEKPEDPEEPVKKLTVKKIESVPTYTVDQGTSSKEALKLLPKSITVTDNKGDTHKVSVAWTIHNYNGEKKGSYPALGSFTLPDDFEGTLKRTVKTYIYVREPVKSRFSGYDSVDPVKIYQGDPLNLPPSVRVKYEDGTVRRQPVTWDLSGFDKNKPGTYTITGTVGDISEKVKITVKVLAKSDNRVTPTAVDLTRYRDIRGHWGEDAIRWTLANGIFKGTYQDTFEPDRDITRGELVTVLFRLGGDQGRYPHSPFSDIGYGVYYDEPIEWARQKNIVTGYEDNYFRPDREITREELATILHRFINYENYKFYGVPREEFSDIGEVADWAKNSVRQLHILGLVNGQGYNKFVPKSLSTRAEVAQILFNMDRKVVSKGNPGSSAKDVIDKNVDRTSPFESVTTIPAVNTERDREQNAATILPGNRVADQTDSTDEEPKKKATGTLSIDVLTLRNHPEMLRESSSFVIPSSGYILKPITVEFEEGETVWDVTKRVSEEYNISLRYQSPGENKYNSVYVQGIDGVGEFDGGEKSGWMININGYYPNVGVDKQKLKDGDAIQWRYTLDYGNDVGGGWS